MPKIRYEEAKTKAEDINLADLNEKSHASLTNVTAAQHHTKTTSADINLADLNEKDHGSLTNITASQHHTKAVSSDIDIQDANDVDKTAIADDRGLVWSDSTRTHIYEDLIKKIQHAEDVDDTGIGDNKILVFRTSSTKHEYEDKPAVKAHFHMPFWCYDSIQQGTWTVGVGDAPDYVYFYNSSANLNDKIKFKTDIDAGTYNLNLLLSTAGAGGIITIYVDGVSQDTIDLYSASAVLMTKKTISVTMTTSGAHTIAIKVTGKNASSSGYKCWGSALWV